MPYTAEDERIMGRIADRAVVNNISELYDMLGEKDPTTKLMASEHLEADSDFRERLEGLVIRLDFLIEVAKWRLGKL
jgi:hypothetical protein